MHRERERELTLRVCVCVLQARVSVGVAEDAETAPSMERVLENLRTIQIVPRPSFGQFCAGEPEEVAGAARPTWRFAVAAGFSAGRVRRALLRGGRLREMPEGAEAKTVDASGAEAKSAESVAVVVSFPRRTGAAEVARAIGNAKTALLAPAGGPEWRVTGYVRTSVEELQMQQENLRASAEDGAENEQQAHAPAGKSTMEQGVGLWLVRRSRELSLKLESIEVTDVTDAMRTFGALRARDVLLEAYVRTLGSGIDPAHLAIFADYAFRLGPHPDPALGQPPSKFRATNMSRVAPFTGMFRPKDIAPVLREGHFSGRMGEEQKNIYFAHLTAQTAKAGASFPSVSVF